MRTNGGFEGFEGENEGGFKGFEGEDEGESFDGLKVRTPLRPSFKAEAFEAPFVLMSRRGASDLQREGAWKAFVLDLTKGKNWFLAPESFDSGHQAAPNKLGHLDRAPAAPAPASRIAKKALKTSATSSTEHFC